MARTYRPFSSNSRRRRSSLSATYTPSMISPPGVPSLQRNSMPTQSPNGTTIDLSRPPLPPSDDSAGRFRQARQFGASSCLCGHYRQLACAGLYTSGEPPDDAAPLVRQPAGAAGGKTSGRCHKMAARLLDAGEREDARDVVAGLAVGGNAVELRHRAFAGIVGGQPELDPPEAVDERLQVLDAGLDVRLRIERIADLVDPRRRPA